MPHPLKETRYLRWSLTYSQELLKGKKPEEIPTFEEWERNFLETRRTNNQRRRDRLKQDPKAWRAYCDHANAHRHIEEYRKKKRQYDRTRKKSQSEIKARKQSRKRWEEKQKLKDPEAWRERMRLKRQRYITRKRQRTNDQQTN